MGCNKLVGTFGIVIVCAIALRAGDISLELSDGSTVLLYENRTWELRGGRDGYVPRSDILIDIDDGKTLILRPNGTWSYAHEDSSSGRPRRPHIRRLQAIGMARAQDSRESLKIAREEAIRRLTQKFQQTLNDPLVSDSSAAFCIRNCLINGLDIEKKIDEDGRAQVTVTLSEERIQDVLDCLGR